MGHDELYEAAQKAITELFSDKSVSQAQTRESLQSLIEEIETMLDTLREDEDEDEID